MTYTRNIFRKPLLLLPVLAAIGFMFSTPMILDVAADHSGGELPPPPDDALLPDITPGIPTHLQIHNQGQGEWLRFTNTWANVGDGSLEFQVGPVVEDKQIAFQNLYDDAGNFANIYVEEPPYVYHEPLGEFIFHPGHNHWHIDDVGDFSIWEFDDPNPEVMGDEIPTIPAPGASNTKIGFCIIDVFRYDEVKSSPSSEKVYWDCEVDLQGIQPGWADQYHQSVEGNEIDVSAIPDGEYLLIHEWNPEGLFIDEDDSNNRSWVIFTLEQDNNGNGNRKATVTGGFAPECDVDGGTTPAICGDLHKNS